MIIGIDGNEANVLNRVGVGQFAYNVIFQLEKNDKNNSHIIYLKEAPKDDFPKEREGWSYKVFGPSNLWTQISLPIKLFTQKEKLSVFYSPSHYAPRFSPVPGVISIMDLWHHHHPEQFAKKDLYQLTNWEKYSVKKAEHIITISEFSKKDIMDIYHVPSAKITVAYPGFVQFKVQSEKFKVEETKKKYGIVGDYFLYIGTLQPKKNIEGLIKAFNILNTKYKIQNTKLIIAGKKGWHYEKIFELVKQLQFEDKVVFTGFVSEEDKPYLLAGAIAFVFPSFYEGFGIPVLEAMSLKVPVITSGEGSLPEVGGEAAIYCNPYEVDSIAGAMEKIINLKEKGRNEIISKGLEQINKFSWEKCAKKVLEALEKTKDVKENY